MISLFFSLVACADVEPTEVHTLEDLSVSATGCEDDSGCEAVGAFAIGTGAEDQDWSLTVGEVNVTVHSSGHADLSVLDGLSGTLHAGQWSFDGNNSAAAVDGQGLVWMAAGSADDPMVTDLLGEGFARLADERVAKGREGDYVLSFHDVVFATDDGDVTVAAGTPTVLTVGGAKFRTVVVAAYDAELAPGAMATDCGGMSDMLSFEMERVEAAEEESPLTRPEGKSIAAGGCGG